MFQMYRKKAALASAAMMALALLSGCSNGAQPVASVTASKETVQAEVQPGPVVYDYKDLGICFTLTGSWQEVQQNIAVKPFYGDSNTSLSGILIIYKDSEDAQRNLAAVVYADMSATTLDFVEEMVGGPNREASVEEIGKQGSNTYYFCSYHSFTQGLSQAQIDVYEKLIADMDTAKAGVVLSQPTYIAGDVPITGQVTLSADTQDLDGQNVDPNLFAAHTLTMINIWGSFCNPCIEEMPTLQKLHEEYSGRGFAIVGVLGDAIDADGTLDADTIDLGKTIAEKNSVTYSNIAMNPELQKVLTTNCYPTSVFVDSQGNIVGDTIFGALPEEEYRTEIEARLEQLGK